MDLIWKFRYYLTSYPKALTKFLRCVDWEVDKQKQEALSLMYA